MRPLILTALGLALSAACTGDDKSTETGDTSAETGETSSDDLTATATLAEANASGVSGTVTFALDGDEVVVTPNLSGLTPGEHGFHVHLYGDCSAADATSTGGHFNPGENDHAGLDDANSHAGDLGNLTADSSGAAQSEIRTRKIALGEGTTDVLGRAVILHQDPDDLTTQPTGNAGSRVACGVILADDGSTSPVLPEE